MEPIDTGRIFGDFSWNMESHLIFLHTPKKEGLVKNKNHKLEADSYESYQTAQEWILDDDTSIGHLSLQYPSSFES